MADEYELQRVLSTINYRIGFDKDNIIEEIKTELEEQDQDLYEEWEKGEFDINHVFPIYSKSMLLTMAAKNGYENIVNALIAAGANVNSVDRDGRTPLDYAEEYAKECAKKYAKGYDKGYYTYDNDKGCAKGYAEEYTKGYARSYAESKNVVKAILEAGGGSFVKARNKAIIAGGVTALLGAAIAVALFTTGTITAQLIPIVIAVVAVTAAALVVGCATYAWSKPSTKVGEVEKPPVVLTNESQEATL